MSRIEAVLFDAGGVLHESNFATENTLKEEFGFDDTIVASIWGNEMNLFGRGAIDETGFWDLCREKYGIRQVLPAENLLGKAYGEQLHPDHNVLNMVDRLGQAGLKLAVLSNTIEPHARALHESGIYAHFDRLFLSHKLGMQKPNPAIYYRVLAELGKQPENMIFVDDKPVNVFAAQKIGIHGVVHEDYPQLEQDITEILGYAV